MAADLLQILRLSASISVLSLLWSCAATPPPQIESDTDIDQFELKGRVAVNLDGRGYSARLKWQHEPASDEMWLYSPVGSTIATVTSDGNRATLVTAKKETFSSDNVQALTRDVLGWDLPLNGLRHWVLGRADPELPIDAVEHDDMSRITLLAQNDWQIDYVAYAEDSALPSSMVLRYSDLRMRLLIDGWKFPSLAE